MKAFSISLIPVKNLLCYKEAKKKDLFFVVVVFCPSGAIHDLDEGYIASRPHNITMWDVHERFPYLSNPRLFANIESDPIGIPDGLRIDKDGNLYVAAGDGVQVFNQNGFLIGKIYLGRQASNLTFGGKGNNILFIAAGPYAYAVSLRASGAVVQ